MRTQRLGARGSQRWMCFGKVVRKWRTLGRIDRIVGLFKEIDLEECISVSIDLLRKFNICRYCILHMNIHLSIVMEIKV